MLDVQSPHKISIHALREESDRHFVKWSDAPKVFQSTPSARRATDDVFPETTIAQISIHALREESDTANNTKTTVTYTFQSTPSARRATRSL